jgi:hypothetical protein
MVRIVKRKDAFGEYEEVWHCEQPELYVVTVRIVRDVEERPE